MTDTRAPLRVTVVGAAPAFEAQLCDAGGGLGVVWRWLPTVAPDDSVADVPSAAASVATSALESAADSAPDLVLVVATLPQDDAVLRGALAWAGGQGVEWVCAAQAALLDDLLADGVLDPRADVLLVPVSTRLLRARLARWLALASERRVRTSQGRDDARIKAGQQVEIERLALAIHGAALGTWHWNMVSDVVQWSARACELFGVQPDEPVTYDRFVDCVHPEDRSHVKAMVREAIARGPGLEMEYRSLWPDGSTHWLVSRGRVYTNAQGVAVRMEGIVRDIGARKRAYEEIQRLNRDLAARAMELEAANHELEAFSASISHDLRTPLRHIDGYVHMLASVTDGQLSPQAQRYLEVIASSGRRMGALIDDLLDFSRSNRTQLRRREINLDSVVRSCVGELELNLRGRHVGWAIEPLPVVQGDLAMIRQVFANLLGNAVKYTRTRAIARIEVGCTRQAGGELVVHVRDNGVGFDMAQADRLYAMFSRLHRNDEFEGTGIGLAIVRRIVERHGGRSWAEGEMGKGATFSFSLPQQPSGSNGASN